jgi:hypothetical protein
MHKRTSRSLALAVAAAMALTLFDVAPASAHHYRHYGNAAVVGAVLGLFGTIAAVAAADRYRDDDYAYGYGGPYYYAPYGYYGGGHGYAPHHFRGYRGRHDGYHHHHH